MFSSNWPAWNDDSDNDDDEYNGHEDRHTSTRNDHGTPCILLSLWGNKLLSWNK